MNLLLLLTTLVVGAANHAPSTGEEITLGEPTARDTFRIEDPQPVLSAEAFDQLAQLWNERRYSGACLRGEIRYHEERGAVLYITHAFSAAYVDMCRGRKNVGAVVFRYDEGESTAELGQETARLLIGRTDWVVVGAVTGVNYVVTRNSRGVIEPSATLSTQFSVWTRATSVVRT